MTVVSTLLTKDYLWIKAAIEDMKNVAESEGIPMTTSDIVRDALVQYFKDYHASNIANTEEGRMASSSHKADSETEARDGNQDEFQL